MRSCFFDLDQNWQRCIRMASRVVCAIGTLGMLAVGGCSNSHSDYKVYQQNITLQNHVTALQLRLSHSQAQVKNLESQLSSKMPRTITLPPARLAELFTVHNIEIKSQTASAKFHGGTKLRGFRVFLATCMTGGTPLPATGKVTITAFDLAIRHGPQKIGQWVFTPRETKQHWYGMFGLNCFAFNCPWKRPPAHSAITFHVRFHDALTGQVLIDQRLIRIRLPK